MARYQFPLKGSGSYGFIKAGEDVYDFSRRVSVLAE